MGAIASALALHFLGIYPEQNTGTGTGFDVLAATLAAEAVAVDFNTLVGPANVARETSPSPTHSSAGHTCCFAWSDAPRNIGIAVYPPAAKHKIAPLQRAARASREG